MLLALLHHGRTDVGPQVVANQDLNVLLGDAALDILEEDLLKEGLKFSHGEPPALVGSKNTARWCTSGPGVVEIAAGTLVNSHAGGEVAITTDAENRAKGSLAVVLDLLWVSNTLLEEALLSPRVVPHARFIIIKDV